MHPRVIALLATIVSVASFANAAPAKDQCGDQRTLQCCALGGVIGQLDNGITTFLAQHGVDITQLGLGVGITCKIPVYAHVSLHWSFFGCHSRVSLFE